MCGLTLNQLSWGMYSHLAKTMDIIYIWSNVSIEKCSSWYWLENIGKMKKWVFKFTCVVHWLFFSLMKMSWTAALKSTPDHPISPGWLVEVLDYFVEQWIEYGEVPIRLWSCCGRRQRTPRRRIWYSKMLGRPSPTIKDVIGVFKTESESTACALMRKNWVECGWGKEENKSTWRKQYNKWRVMRHYGMSEGHND